MANANGWGDGSVNNNIGWGQAPNNNISWGKSQITSYSGATDIDGGNTPVNTVAPAITGTAQEGQTLTCSTGTWSGSPSYNYQWKRNGSNIGSATNSTYTLVTADVGQSIKCTVTATNFIGSASADSNTVTPTSSTDADAQAFITAAAITDPTQQAAINTLVVDLKGYSIWTKMKALYPFVGGTASQHKFNLKDPRDLDAAFRLTFHGDMLSSSNGIKGTINGYADTKLNLSTQTTLNDIHLGFYSRTHSTQNSVDIGASTDNVTNYYLLQLTGSTTYYIINESAFITYPNFSDTDTRGLYVGTRSGTVVNGWKNGIKRATKSPATTAARPNQSVFLSAYNQGGVPASYSNRQLAFSSIGDGLTDTEAANFYTAVQAFQTTLGRQV
jgi:hypothetical protein